MTSAEYTMSGLKTEAFTQVIEAMCEKYPPPWGGWRARSHRSQAIWAAQRGMIAFAIEEAVSGGLPRDELVAAALLLDLNPER